MNSIITKSLKGLTSLFIARFKILTYHGVPKSNPEDYEVSLKNFSYQMKILSDKGFNVIPLHEAIRRLYDATIEPRTIVITFDDGHESIWENAIPLLKQYSFPSTVFIPTGLVGKVDTFSGFKGIPRKLADWQTISHNQQNNEVSIGGHSITHCNLCNLSKQELEVEINASYEELSNRLGQNNYYFAYPFGLLNESVKNAVENSNYCGALCFGSVLSNSQNTDPYLLKREKILSKTTDSEFFKIIDTKKDLPRALKAIYNKHK